MTRRSLRLAALALPAGLLALTLALLPAQRPASAYTIMTAQQTGVPLKWTSWPMKFSIHNAAAPGVSLPATQAAIRASYTTWDAVSCAQVSFKDLGVVNLPTGNKNDGVNTSYFPSSWNPSFGSNALGVTQTYYDPNSGKILDADIAYNPGRSWSTTGAWNKIDLQSVATHEIGHQLGLNHSQYPDATMYYATGAGNTGGRSLHSDDIAGVCAQYPNGGTLPPECTNNTHCATGEVCQNQKCVPGSSTPKKGYGSPCGNHSECQSGVCVPVLNNNYFCSADCASASCPNGDKCETFKTTSGQQYQLCVPGSNTWYTKGLGASCQQSIECKDKYCAPVQGGGYVCARQCDVSQNNCPAGYLCTKYYTSGGSYIGLCVPGTKPTPTKKLGESCTGNDDCVSGLCGQLSSGSKVCISYCELNKAGACPTGFSCVPISGSTKGACVKDGGSTPTKKDLGASCSANDECKSGACEGTGSGKVCVTYCDPQKKNCASGYTCKKLTSGKWGCVKDGGTTPPGKKDLGAPCSSNADCKSDLCASNGSSNFCTRFCDPAKGCGDGFNCVPAGDKYACAPVTTTPPPPDQSGGCAVSAEPGSGSAALLLIFGLPFLFWLRRRQR